MRRQDVITKNGQVDDMSDAESTGIGARVLVDGAWGFAGAGRLDETGARDAPPAAVAIGRAPQRRAPSTSPAHHPVGARRTWRPSRLTPASTARRSSATPSPSR